MAKKNNKNTNAALEVSDQAEYMNMLKNAPIAELAAYVGVDIDTAVQLRIDEAVSETYDKLGKQNPDMTITVRPIEQKENSKLLGFASVEVSGIKIDDFKIVDGADGLFVGAPSKKDSSS